MSFFLSILSLSLVLSISSFAEEEFDSPHALSLFHSKAIEISLSSLRKHISNMNAIHNAEPALEPTAEEKAEAEKKGEYIIPNDVVDKVEKQVQAELLLPIQSVQVKNVKVLDFDDSVSRPWAIYKGEVTLTQSEKRGYFCTVRGKVIQGKTPSNWKFKKIASQHCRGISIKTKDAASEPMEKK